jgi:type VI secretion system protein VasG
MTVKDIPRLLEKLNDYCQNALATAVGVCVSRGHYEVRWEHLLLEFIDRNDGDVPLILRQFGVDPSHLKKAVTRELENLRTGNTGKPLFSPPLLDTFEFAWTLASLDFGLPSISSGTLFLAAFERGQLAMSSYGDLLTAINQETLKKNFHAITKTSVEQTGKTPSDTTGAGPKDNKSDVLEQFCTNFTRQAADGKIDPILGRDNEIRQALDILSRRRKNNPILVGEAGVGKTAIVEGIALRIVANDVPDHLKNVDLWGLDLGLLQAGASVKGEFEKRLKNVIDSIKNSPKPTILFIDEAHTLIGAGGSAGQGDAANLLKPALARGELRTLAATTWSEYRKYFEKDPALARRFQLVKIEEPNEATCSVMMRGIAASYEKHHSVRISSDAIRSAVSLSLRYISGRQLPDKAVDVLDTACARVKMSQSVKPASLDNSERTLQNAELELKTLQKDQNVGIVFESDAIAQCTVRIAETKDKIARLALQWEKEKALALAIIKLQDELTSKKEAPGDNKNQINTVERLKEETEKLDAIQGENPMVFPFVSPSVCAQVIADWTGIPVGSMVKDEATALLELEGRLKERVIGQDDALSELANTIRASKTGMGNPDAPLGVFLFTGPSGVGKTECALALADQLFGGEKFMTVINMSEYQEKHTVSQLKGSPPGYVGYGEGGILTEAVRQKPYSIVILDEVEKAHIEVMNIFYQVFDKGVMRDGEGREINFRNTLIIMTSNLASETIIELCGGEEEVTSAALIEAIRPQLSNHFQPALLARCKIVPFRPLSKEIMRGVVAIKLDKIAQRIHKVHGMTLSCSPDLIDQIAESCTAVEAGARNADAVIDKSLLPGISRQLLLHLGEGDKKYTRVHIGATTEGDFEIIFSEQGDDMPKEEPAEVSATPERL